MNPATPTCKSCGTKFPGVPCQKCGYDEVALLMAKINGMNRSAAHAEDNWNTAVALAPERQKLHALRMPGVTRRRRRHGRR